MAPAAFIIYLSESTGAFTTTCTVQPNGTLVWTIGWANGAKGGEKEDLAASAFFVQAYSIML